MFLVLLFWAVVAASSVPALAQPSEAEAYKGWRISKVQIRGVPGDQESDLKKGLILTGESRMLRRKYPVFYPSVLEEDLDRIRLYLARNGYPRARVTASFVPKPTSRRIAVNLEIDPGQAMRIDSVIVEGVPPELHRRANRALSVAECSFFVEDNLVKSVEGLGSVMRDAGYALVGVKSRIEESSSEAVAVHFVVTPGEPHVFREIHVEGISDDLVPLAIRTMDIDPGDRYSAEALKRAHENLRLLNLFRRIRLTTAKAAPGTLDVKAELSEREPRTIQARGGYWSEDKIRAQLSWQHRTLFRRGRGLSVRTSGSKFLVDGEVSTWWPALIGPRTRESLTLGVRFENEDRYRQLGAGIELASLYRRSFRTTYRVSAAVLYVKVDESSLIPGLIDDQGFLVPITGAWNWDTSDDRINPSRGTVTWLNAEYTPPKLSDNEYIRGEAGGSFYFPLPKKSVLAIRIVLGLANPLGETTDLIPGKRFYAGGVNSNRGFQRRKLGPLDLNGDPIGGQAKIETMTEVRFSLVWKLEAALFLDVGQVWRRAEFIDLSDLEPSAGPALMINSPVGPIRADYGIRLRDSGDQKSEVFHFTIGHPF
jgi:outer membrane protein assembly complex protein YaeT